MTRIWWVRHGPTHEKGFVGWRDVPVDLSDTAKTERLDAYLPRRAILVSSDLERAIKTAYRLNEARFRQPNEPDLREFDFGAWDGEVWEDIAARDPTLSRDFWDKPGDLAPPGGESWNAVSARVQAATARLVAAHPGREIVLVAHFGAILTHMAGAGGLGARQALSHKLDPLSVTRLDFDGRAWHLGTINHLP